MPKWTPTERTHLVAFAVSDDVFQHELEQIALVVYKGICRTQTHPKASASPLDKIS